MIERLSRMPNERAVLANDASDWHARMGRRIPVAYIEKDFWVTEALRSLSVSLQFPVKEKPTGMARARVIFKGGTSLSKAHGLIDRFSEDIDLYVVTRFDAGQGTEIADFTESPVGDKRADKLFQFLADRVARDLGFAITDHPQKKPRSGTRRAYQMEYATESTPVSVALKHSVDIELTRMGNPEPNDPHQVHSLLAEYVLTTRLPGTDFEELSPFTVDVLMPHRTLVEKLCALQHCADNTKSKNEPFAHMSRHFYDVYQLLGAESVIESLATDNTGIAGIAADHVERSKRARRKTGIRPDDGFSASTWVVDKRVQALAEASYQTEVPPLVYTTAPPFSAILERMHQFSTVL